MAFGVSVCVCSLSFFFSSRRRHTRFKCDWSSDVCSSDLRFECIFGHITARRKDNKEVQCPYGLDYIRRRLLRHEHCSFFGFIILSLAVSKSSVPQNDVTYDFRVSLEAPELVERLD